MQRKSLLCALLALALLGSIGSARALAAAPLTVALYAPNAPFPSGEASYSFVSQLAQRLATTTGQPFEAKAYAHAADFEAAVRQGQVAYAVVDAVYLAERGVSWPVLATATSGGDTAMRWGLFATQPGRILDMQGKRLAYARTGARDPAFLDNALLSGELPNLWASREAAPGVASAVAAVSLHKADAVFAPEAAARSLQRVFDAGRIPNPALVEVAANLPPTVSSAVRGAIPSLGASGTYDGWRPSSAEPYHALAARLVARTRRPVMADPPLVSIDPMQALALPPLEPASGDLTSAFFPPPGHP